jgi:hypothetical protein
VWSCEREEGGPGCRSEVTLKSRYRGHCTGGYKVSLGDK